MQFSSSEWLALALSAIGVAVQIAILSVLRNRKLKSNTLLAICKHSLLYHSRAGERSLGRGVTGDLRIPKWYKILFENPH